MRYNKNFLDVRPTVLLLGFALFYFCKERYSFTSLTSLVFNFLMSLGKRSEV